MAASSAPAAATKAPSEPQLVGTWRLVSFELRNGTTVMYPHGNDAQGQIIYDAIGNMSCHLINPNPPERPTDAKDGAAYEARMSFERYSSYYGPYDVDVAHRRVNHHVVGALMPGWVGTTVTRDYVFEGPDDLTLSAMTGPDQQAVLKWRRAK